MKRYEYIVQGGKEEMARAIAFCNCCLLEQLDIRKFTCEELKTAVNETAKELMEWLDSEVEE